MLARGPSGDEVVRLNKSMSVDADAGEGSSSGSALTAVVSREDFSVKHDRGQKGGKGKEHDGNG